MFDSREAAGILLAGRLQQEKIAADVVAGIARGGVVVANAVAKELKLPITAIAVKKLGAPNNPELAIGAIAPDDVIYLDDSIITSVGADKTYINAEIRRKHHELEDKMKLINQVANLPAYKSQRVILTDDGVATGATFLVSIDWLKQKRVKSIIAAIPVGARAMVEEIEKRVDICISLEMPTIFGAIGQFYREFEQVEDSEVVKILASRR